jgi:hypothetical protein
MTRTTLRERSSSTTDSPGTFADRIAEAIGDLLAGEPSSRRDPEPHPQTLEQLIARAICKELPR